MDMDAVWTLVKSMKYQMHNVSESGVSALIKITSSCRSKCKYCLSWKTKQETLSLDTISSIVDNIIKFAAYRIVLSGGEPTVHPEFSSIVKECLTAGRHLAVITDGQYEQNSSWTSMVDEIVFSIDTHDPDLYSRIRGMDGLSCALNNLSLAVETGVDVSVNIVLSRKAIKELDKTVDLLASKGVSRIYFLQLETHLGIANDIVPLDNDLSNFKHSLLPSIQCKYPKLFPKERLLPPLSKKTYRPGGAPCLIPWMHVTIRPNGNVFPCCRIGDDTPDGNERTFCLGNIKETSLCDLWQSSKRKHIQASIASSPPEPCRKCEIGALFKQPEEEIWNHIESIRM